MRFSTRRWSSVVKKGFTLREILVIVVVISVGLLSVLVVLTNGMKYVQKTRQKVIALNLAREGMEAVYQIRDTNRTRRAGVKDACWLKTNPLVNEAVDVRCADDPWMMSGVYVLQRLTLQWQEYFALTGIFSPLNISDGIDTGDLQFSLCQTGGRRDSCMWSESLSSEWKYFRQIIWRGLYHKDVPTTWWTEIVCSSGVSFDCADSRPKEFRFCSSVSYVSEWTGQVELCGVITNFK